MSMMNDYTIQILTAQRHQEFLAEAENRRLARIARGDRLTWRQRISTVISGKPATPCPPVPSAAYGMSR